MPDYLNKDPIDPEAMASGKADVSFRVAAGQEGGFQLY